MYVRLRKMVLAAVAAALGYVGAEPAAADVSAFVGVVGFDSQANLESSPGVGLRWGRSGGLFGGETSLMISRPKRDLRASNEAATAIFYEGRFLVNIPAGQIRPFLGVGFGAITLTSTDPPTELDGVQIGDALNAVTDLQTNSALSYGGGLRYRLADQLDIRFDMRQYLVFSVKSAAVSQIAEETGIGENIVEDKTVRYNELSIGITLNF